MTTRAKGKRTCRECGRDFRLNDDGKPRKHRCIAAGVVERGPVGARARQAWTDADDAAIRQGCLMDLRPSELAEQLQRSAHAVQIRAYRLRRMENSSSIRFGKLRGTNRPWTTTDRRKLLARAAQGEDLRAIAKDLGRSYDSVRDLVPSTKPKPHWTTHEKSKLRKLVKAKTPIGAIAAELGKTRRAVAGQLRGRQKYRERWTPKLDARLVHLAVVDKLDADAIAEALGKTTNAIRLRAQRLRRAGVSVGWGPQHLERHTWTTHQLRDLQARRDAGETYEMLGERFGCSPAAARIRLQKWRKACPHNT
jgi:hypothetical protein